MPVKQYDFRKWEVNPSYFFAMSYDNLGLCLAASHPLKKLMLAASDVAAPAVYLFRSQRFPEGRSGGHQLFTMVMETTD